MSPFVKKHTVEHMDDQLKALHDITDTLRSMQSPLRDCCGRMHTRDGEPMCPIDGVRDALYAIEHSIDTIQLETKRQRNNAAASPVPLL